MNNDYLAIDDQGTRELEQPLVAPGPLLEPDQQLSEPVEPGERPFHHPAAGRVPAGLGGDSVFAAGPDMRHVPGGSDGVLGPLAEIPLVRTEMDAVGGRRADQAMGQGGR